MNELDINIRRISAKLQQLLKQYQHLEKEKEQLQAQLKKKQEQEILFLDKIAELEQRVGLLKASTGNLSPQDKLSLEKNINKHLKEIEKCITNLSE